MKKLLLILVSALCTLHSAFGLQVFPWIYRGTDLDGTALTNDITIEAWPQTNAITAVITNLVASFSKTYSPTNPAGYYSNNLAPGNYRLTIYGQTRGVTFTIVSNSGTLNLAQVSGAPVPLFMNFTIAQFSDAGTASYSNSTAFALRSFAGVVAALGYTPPTNSYTGLTNAMAVIPATNSNSGIVAALGYTPPTNSYTGLTNAMGVIPATNSNSGIVAALGYTPPTNSYTGLTNAMAMVPATNSNPGIVAALGYTPPTNSYTGLTNAMAVIPATNSHTGIASALTYTPATNTPAGLIAALTYTPATNGTTAMTNLLFKTNYLASTHTPVSGYGFLASSNGALYWITAAKTNLLSNGF